jgi:tRNA-specific 2-thiouridylase
VLDVSVVDNTVTVGPSDALQVTAMDGATPVWLESPPTQETELAVQVRAHGEPVPCKVVRADDEVVSVDVTPGLTGIAPGQTMVLYDGSRVVGSATISGTRRAAA